MDYLQASEYEIQKLKDQNTMLQTQTKLQELLNESYNKIIPIPYINSYPINCGCGYNPINYQMLNVNSTINSGFIEKETTIENKEIEEMIFDYNREFVYQSEWDKYGCDLEEYNSISNDEKRLFEEYKNECKFYLIECYSNSIYIQKNFDIYGKSEENYRKYSFLKKDFNYKLEKSIIDKNLEQLNKKFRIYKNYKQNKKFIDKYYDKILPDNIQTNYDYIDELIKESEE